MYNMYIKDNKWAELNEIENENKNKNINKIKKIIK